ncbi:MAG: hypothetical protein M1825_003367 [Sarcosagium campestre]|nr:MAG: hypothetical protein M1825_003367 [Sarcosagium campestre]
MVLKLAHLQGLRLAQLKQIAVRCGVNSTGTKTAIASSIQQELSKSIPSCPAVPPRGSHKESNDVSPSHVMPNAPRVLSIDMGIRNLAYCVFDTPPRSSMSAESSILPAILAWRRLSMCSPPSDAGQDEPMPAKESFEPAVYAVHAFKLLSEVLSSHQPDLVLIERQRYRSMGSSTILEWTVRVNMLEGMLHAVLHTLEQTGQWQGIVASVSPAKVTSFWVGDEVRKTLRKEKSAKARSKGAKIDLVGTWLDHGGVVRLETSTAQATGDAFLEKWKGTRSTRRSLAKVKGETKGTSSHEVIGKLDDLADCLLQGMAWLSWSDNKRLLLERGTDALLKISRSI